MLYVSYPKIQMAIVWYLGREESNVYWPRNLILACRILENNVRINNKVKK
jgi:hypothetical protein